MPINEVGQFISGKPKEKRWEEKLKGFDEHGIRPVLVVEESFRPGSISVALQGRLPSNLMALTQSLGATASWMSKVTTQGLLKPEQGATVPRHHLFLWRIVRHMVRLIWRLSVFTLKQDGVRVEEADSDRFSGTKEMIDHFEEEYRKMGYD